jgi:cell division protein FtsB
VIYSYLNPLIDLFQTYTATSDARVKLHEELDENKRLHRRLQSADDPVFIEAQARSLGMVRPGETPLVRRGGESP